MPKCSCAVQACRGLAAQGSFSHGLQHCMHRHASESMQEQLGVWSSALRPVHKVQGGLERYASESAGAAPLTSGEAEAYSREMAPCSAVRPRGELANVSTSQLDSF